MTIINVIPRLSRSKERAWIRGFAVITRLRDFIVHLSKQALHANKF